MQNIRTSVPAMTRTDLYDFLQQCKLGVLATTGPAHMPQAALVGVAVTKELEIVFDTVETFPPARLRIECETEG
jgi:hypothetical protein